MDKVQKQRGSIVLHKETRDGADYIRIEYASSQAVAQLLAQDTGMEMTGNGSAYIASAAFSLPDTDWGMVILFGLCIVLLRKCKMNPVTVMFLAGILKVLLAEGQKIL